MSNTNCAIDSCKTTVFNKGPGIILYACPTGAARRKAWLQVLKDRCSALDWSRSKICSKHFENKYFDNRRNLKENAVPTLFPATTLKSRSQNVSILSPNIRTKVDRMLNKFNQAELMADVKTTMSQLSEPSNLSDFIGNDLKCVSGTPIEGQLWLLVKKQDHLNTRLMETIARNKKNVEMAQKNVEDANNAKKEFERNIETFKYMIKCLQEKHATLEEQIEILSSVESR